MRFSTLIVTIGFLASASCVSVKLAKPEHKRAAGVKFNAPAAPFAADSSKDVDAAWQNQNNGNSISYISDCTDESDPTLDTIVQGALGGLAEMHFDKKENLTLQGRAARRVLVSGKVDGVPSRIDMIAFKRDSCIYILSYVGVQKSFAENHSAFDGFVEGFQAP